MDIRKIRKLIEMINETGVAEIEIKEGEESVRIRRVDATMVHMPSPMPAQIQVTPAVQTSASVPAMPQTDTALSEHLLLKSPMVGTFYAAASPEAKPFAEIGQRVEAGQVICLIEAMKMFNEIEADRSGIIKKIFLQNGQPVEYGQPLFVIE